MLLSIHLRASGPSLRISSCSSLSFSINVFLNLLLLVLTSFMRDSSSHTDESRRFFDIGRSVVRVFLSTAPVGFRRNSTIYQKRRDCNCLELRIRVRPTFGTNTKHKVVVVQNIIKTEISIKTASFRSDMIKAMDPPIMHIIVTLYTDRPMCLESFRAGIETFRVSHARKAPKTRSKPLYAYIIPKNIVMRFD